MNRMEGIRFTRNRQNTLSFAKLLAGNPTWPLACRHSSSQVTSAVGIPFPDFRSVLFEMCSSRKNPYPPQGRSSEIPRGGGGGGS